MNINLTAPINSLGYGVVGLNVSLAFERLGHNPALWPIGGVDAPQQHHEALRQMERRTEAYSTRSPSLRIWHQFNLAQHVGRGPHCGMPIFELNRFRPMELHHLRNQDILFANSHWAGEVLMDNGVDEKSIQYAPLGIDTTIFRPVDCEFVDQGEGTTFVNIGKWEYRKGHDILVEAFNKAFESTDNVKLMMNCYNPCLRTEAEAERYNGQWTQLYKGSKLGEKIFVYDRRLPTQRDVALLMANADCGVFPSRAEGWNLDAAEMLAMGKHVILTDYSAHCEFANESNSHLIQVNRLEDAHDGIWFRADLPEWGGKPGQWAELGDDQVDQLVHHLRRIHRLKMEGALKPNVAGLESMRHLTWDNTVNEIIAVLSQEWGV